MGVNFDWNWKGTFLYCQMDLKSKADEKLLDNEIRFNTACKVAQTVEWLTYVLENASSIPLGDTRFIQPRSSSPYIARCPWDTNLKKGKKIASLSLIKEKKKLMKVLKSGLPKHVLLILGLLDWIIELDVSDLIWVLNISIFMWIWMTSLFNFLVKCGN